MKYLILVLTFLSICSNAKATGCTNIYKNELFSLCANQSNDNDFIRTRYDIYAIHNNSGEKSFISQQIFLAEVAKITQVNSSEFFFKSFIGGNSPPSEHRHVLLIVGENAVFNAGTFAGFADIDNDLNKDYFRLELTSSGTARVYDKYEKKKLIIRNNKLVSDQ